MHFRQPSYFSGFKCVGGDCRFTCCQNWFISWKEEEINKVKDDPRCSPKLRELFSTNFYKTDSQKFPYVVKIADGERCPFQDTDRLCMVQKELGAEYLSYTCRVYPRHSSLMLDVTSETYNCIYRYCNLSCPEVAKHVVLDKNSMMLVNLPLREEYTAAGLHKYDDAACEKNPELIFRMNFFELYYDLISDKRYSAETAVIHGAIAASILTDIVNEKNYGAILPAIEEIREGFLKGNLFKDIDEIKPDYIYKVGLVGSIIRNEISGSTLNAMNDEDGKLDLDLYRKGEEELRKMFDGDDYWLRNIALSLLFELSMPYYSIKYTLFDNYSMFMAALACVKLNAIASVSRDGRMILKTGNNYTVSFLGKDKVWGFASFMCRSLCQSSKGPDRLLQTVKDAGLTTPMQLALLVK